MTLPSALRIIEAELPWVKVVWIEAPAQPLEQFGVPLDRAGISGHSGGGVEPPKEYQIGR